LVLPHLLWGPGMSLPVQMRPLYRSLSPEAQISISTDYNRRRKSKTVAYLAWFFLGWHYLYLRRVGLQFAFWLTAGGLMLWWLLDLFRVGPIVNRMNEDTARELMVQYKALFAKDPGYRVVEVRTPAVPNVVPSGQVSTPAPVPVPVPVPTSTVTGRPGSLKPVIIGMAAIVAIGAGYLLIPSRVFSKADTAGHSFRTVRQVNVRRTPTSTSAVLRTLPRGELLRGTMEVGPNGVARWLHVESGSSSGGYVAASNLERAR